MKVKRWLVLGVVLFIIGMMFFQRKEETDILARYDLEKMNLQERIAKLEEWQGEMFNAGIRNGYLEISDGKELYREMLNEDTFYLSIAPYLRNTHPCDYHSLSGCKAELKNEEFELLVMDRDGNVLVNEMVTTYENGFYGIWLPRDIEGIIQVKKDGKVAETTFETYLESKTCLTDLKLV